MPLLSVGLRALGRVRATFNLTDGRPSVGNRSQHFVEIVHVLTSLPRSPASIALRFSLARARVWERAGSFAISTGAIVRTASGLTSTRRESWLPYTSQQMCSPLMSSARIGHITARASSASGRSTEIFASRVPKRFATWSTDAVEVWFVEWTREGLLRHPEFVSVRPDREPREVLRE